MRFISILVLLFAVHLAAAQPAKSPTGGGPASSAQPAATADLTSLPMGKGLPVRVRTGVSFQSVTLFDDSEGAFTGTVDLRLRWEDPRLRYPADTTPRGFKEFRGADADQKLKELWTPPVAFANLKDSPAYQATSVRIFPTGWVEVMQRTTGKFVIPIDAANFPFDKQALGVNVILRRETTGEASLVVLQEDIEFSQPDQNLAIDGWTPGLVNIKRYTEPGWYGESHSGLVVSLSVARNWGRVVMAVFVPLFAALFIPMLAIWMNKSDEGEFEIDTFELANIVVGGLFAVIALNFTINSVYRAVATGDNTVTRLFTLNYVGLGLGLAVVVLLYRYNIPMKIFGRYFQEQLYFYLSWAVPLLAFGTALAFILSAAA